MSARIEDYAMLGDCRSAALVARDGSIDWLCLPRFDSDALFAALLGTRDHGRWLLAPAAATRSRRRYRDGSLILETHHETDTGVVEVIDFMVASHNGHDHSHLVRRVRGLRGRVRMRSELVVRFGYGRRVPWVTRIDGGICAVAGPDQIVVRTPVALHGHDLNTEAAFEVAEGETVSFVLSHGASHLELPPAIDAEDAFARTERFWMEWSGRCTRAGRWSELVRRSLVVLKGLSYLPTGAIVAAPTASLPERIGGNRNWDYRYCWLRDSTFVLVALINAGYRDEAIAFRDWLKRAVAGTPGQLQALYGVAGERRLAEWDAHWLPGYENSRPVNIGNAAAEQFQLDVYGELIATLELAERKGMAPARHGYDLERAFLRELEKRWREPDEGIWEVRGGRRHFTHSKVLSWLAFDRASRNPAAAFANAERARWATLAREVHADILANAVHADGHFVQSYGSDRLDAALLVIPLVGFLPPDDPRVVNTVAAIEQRLTVDGMVERYRADTHARDGLPPGEGTFLACSFWLVECLVMMDRLEDAEALFERLAGLCNDVGLLAEEYDPRGRRMLGNFPQGYSHVALVNAAYRLEHARAQRASSKEVHG
ncbi:glycoside hydrolase family 15 protein [Coralloluteibacterium stylophorae]|uniref:Glycoside hydrolase family 15 protein n=1 Tax=Coralloluteibacterium stylophorae TaxID=1776034 RepID=A0A8J8AZ07_9GAMM|nr:glycoside hydrolase family 15 protein [Coralloluteibacterium stylophorae]MBS7456154.1 glycoside hydrolase family 15 protein [Coralloluteibacterium stylophorae]